MHKMDSFSGNNVIIKDELTSRSLPSLFGLCNGTVATTMAGKDLDGLIALNDSALSQQIEFILQDATMEHDDNTQGITQNSAGNIMQTHATRMIKTEEPISADYDSNSQATSMSPIATIKLETPPTSTTPITSASELSQTGLESEFTQIKSPKSQIHLQIKQHQTQQQSRIHQQLTQQLPQQHLQQQLFNGRRIILRSSALNELSSFNIGNLDNQVLQHLAGEEEDPELNDENLQDIEEEAKAAEAEEEPSLQFHTTNTHIKLENPTELTLETTGDFIHTNSTGHLSSTTQLVLPRTIAVPVSEALVNLQRRPVFISSSGGNIQGGTIVRVPAVLNRNGSMTVFNVVQQSGAIGGVPTTTQLILQTAATSNSGNVSANLTPLMVTSSAQTNKLVVAEDVSSTITNTSPVSATTSLLVNSTSPTNAKTIINNTNNHNNNNNINNNNNCNTTNYSRIVANGNIVVSSATPNTTALLTESQFENHPVASTSAAALATLNALNNNNNNHTNNNNKNNDNSNNSNNNNKNNSINNNSTSQTSLAPQTIASTSKASSLLSSSNTSTSLSSNGIIYQCVDCVEKFDSKDLFDIHRSGHANNMKCAICNMVLKSLKNYEKHCLRCKPYECQICGRVVRFRPNFIKHMRVHTGQQSERHKYKCEVCHKEFMSFEYFKVHKKIHNENVNLTCEICGKVFSALASLRGHSKLHSGVKLHKCDVCGKGFGQRYNLKIHARTHTGDFPYECKVCKKKLHTQSSLQTHMQVHEREQPREQSQKQAATSTATVAVAKATTTSAAMRYQNSNINNNNNNSNANSMLVLNNSVIKVEPNSSSFSLNNSSSLSLNAKTSQRGKTVLQKNQFSLQSLKLKKQVPQQQQQQQQLRINISNNNNNHNVDGEVNYTDNTIDIDGFDDVQDDDDNNSGLSESDLNVASFHNNHHHINNEQSLNQQLYMNEEDVHYRGSVSGSASGSGCGNANASDDDTSSSSQSEQSHLVLGTPARTILINNYLSSGISDNQHITMQQQEQQQQQPLHNQAQVIRHNKNVDSALQQQLLRKTPIIHSTSGLTNNNKHQHTVNAIAQSVLQQIGTPSANIVLTSSTTSSTAGSISTKKITADGSPFTTSSIIRNTHNSQQQQNQHQGQQSFNMNSTNSNNIKHNNHYNEQHEEQQQQSSLYQRNNHRNHHRRRHLADLDDDDDEDDDGDHLVNNGDSISTKLPRPTLIIAQQQHQEQHTITSTINGRRHRRPFDDDDDDDMMAGNNDDDKCSPSLALTAIKIEPNLYTTGDNSNEMLIKEEAIFDNSPRPQSPQSPPSSRYRMPNFDSDLDHHSDLSHSLPTYGYLLDHHTIPDGMPTQLYADDDDDNEFKLGHSSLTAVSSGSDVGGIGIDISTLNATDASDYIKKEWPSYSNTSAEYSINGKFDDDSDVLCDAANFIYN